MKLTPSAPASCATRSLPVRERGLKHPELSALVGPNVVAPRAGAWIEASYGRIPISVERVAPRAGAWIEAPRTLRAYAGYWVAPRAGAWIEGPSRSKRLSCSRASLSVRERGLKQVGQKDGGSNASSLPVRERGLKLFEAQRTISKERSLPVRERGLKHAATPRSCPAHRSLPVRERGLMTGEGNRRGEGMG